MTAIRTVWHADGLELTARGHAGDVPPGENIVCAAVSALLFGFVAYLCGEPSVGVCAEMGTLPHSLPGRGGQGSVTLWAGDGLLRVRTRGMAGIDRAAWTVTAAGLALVAARYPTCVQLETAQENTNESERKAHGTQLHHPTDPL